MLRSLCSNFIGAKVTLFSPSESMFYINNLFWRFNLVGRYFCAEPLKLTQASADRPWCLTSVCNSAIYSLKAHYEEMLLECRRCSEGSTIPRTYQIVDLSKAVITPHILFVGDHLKVAQDKLLASVSGDRSHTDPRMETI